MQTSTFNLNTSFKNNDLRKITESLNLIKQNEYFHNKKDEYDLINEVKDAFKLNNFYLPNLKGTIDENKWDLSHEICSFIYDYKFRNDLKLYLIELKNNSSDFDEKYRVGYC